MRVIGRIYEEENYDVFRRLPDNRDVLSQRFNKLLASLKEHYILNPIIVNEKMEIIDGQGRFEARKALNQPIHYIIANGANSNDCRRMNKYNTRWSSLDFAKSYAKAGVTAYVNLLQVCKETSLSIPRVLRLSNHASTAKRIEIMSNFEKGELVFGAKDIESVIDTNKKADEITQALQFTGQRNDAFYTAVKIMIETSGYNHNRMVRKCMEQRSTYVQMARIGDQLIEFERIYNYKTNQNSRLYFSDYMRNRGSNVRNYKKTYSPYSDADVSTLKEEE